MLVSLAPLRRSGLGIIDARNHERERKTMKYLWLTLNWIFGLLFLLSGVVYLFNDLKIAIPLVAIALLLLPPVRNFVYSKTQKELPFKVRAISIIIFMIVFGIFANQIQNRKEENIKYFNENSSKILSDVRDAIKSKEYEKAISLSAEYLPSDNLELLKLFQSAKSALAEIDKTEKTKEILAELKTIPEKEYKKNRDLYQQLTALRPDSEKYKSKLSYYKAKMAEKTVKKKQVKKKQVKKKQDDTKFIITPCIRKCLTEISIRSRNMNEYDIWVELICRKVALESNSPELYDLCILQGGFLGAALTTSGISDEQREKAAYQFCDNCYCFP